MPDHPRPAPPRASAASSPARRRSPAPPAERAFDLVVYGASGFTGRLVAEALQRSHGGAPRGGPPLRWALAGRDTARLEAVRDAIGAPASLSLLHADARDPASLQALAARTRAVVTTVGPYTHHGEPLVEACAAAGTDSLDLCGEPLWMARMIERHGAAAAASGARIVMSCGFDSVPFDLGVRFLQDAALAWLGAPLVRVRSRVVAIRGGVSGGTAASLIASLDEADGDAAALARLADPFALTPGFRGPPQPDDGGAEREPDGRHWSGPFLMAPINTKNVHRSHQLLGHPWGRDFVYDERMVTGTGLAGQLRARALAAAASWQQRLLGLPLLRRQVHRHLLPAPGRGPGAAQRERGFYRVRIDGDTADGRTLAARVDGERDPGYGSTSRILAECAVALLRDVPRRRGDGGITTPAAALGLAVLPALAARAGLRFAVADDGDGGPRDDAHRDDGPARRRARARDTPRRGDR